MKTKPIIAAILSALMLAGCAPAPEQKAVEKPVETVKIIEQSNPIPAPIQVREYRDIPLSKKLQDDVFLAAEEFNISPDIIFAVMEVESNYQVDAQNGECIGLMQIHTINESALIDDIGITSLNSPSDNIRAGARILSNALSEHNLTDSLMIYNNGYSGAQKLWKQGKHETGYTRKVLERIKGA